MDASAPIGSQAPVGLSPRQAMECLGRGAMLLDIREAYETNYRIPDVPAILHVPNKTFMDRWREIPRDVALILLDNVGVRGREIALFLSEQGFSGVTWIIGGIVDWVRDGLPVLRDSNYELRGQCSCKLRPVNPKEPPKWTK